MSSGAESEVSGGPGEGVGDAVLAAVGRSKRRSSGNDFLPEPTKGKMDDGGQPAPPTPRAALPQGWGDQWKGAESHDVKSHQQTSSRPRAPPPAPPMSPGATWRPPLREDVGDAWARIGGKCGRVWNRGGECRMVGGM